MSVPYNYDTEEIAEEIAEDYELEFRKIITDAVKYMIKSTVEELKSEKEKNKNLLEMIRTQRLEIETHEKTIQFTAALEHQVQSCLRVGIEQQDEIRFLKNKVRLLENQIKEYEKLIKDLEV